MKNNMKLEESLQQLEEIVKQLEEKDCNLEESLALYKKGVKLLNNCSDSIEKIEKELIILKE